MKRVYEPWYTACLSRMIPGLGQFISGRWIIAGLFLLASISLLILAYWLLITDRLLAIIPAAIVILLAICLPFVSALECAIYIKMANREQTLDYWFPVFLSSIIGGLGYLYQKKWNFFMIWLVIQIFLSYMSHTLKLPIIADITGSLIAVAVFGHVYIIYSKESFKQSCCQLKAFLSLVIVMICGNIIILSFSNHYAFLSGIGNGPSMEPTLPNHSRVIINNFAYLAQNPKLGDIIVLRTPDWVKLKNHNFIIKRIIAVGGDTVEIRDGKVYVNSELKHWSVLPVVVTKGNDHILNVKPMVIPPNSYYVLGDNIEHSYDSRFFGVIEKNLILGKVIKIWWPLSSAKLVIQ